MLMAFTQSRKAFQKPYNYEKIKLLPQKSMRNNDKMYYLLNIPSNFVTSKYTI